MPDNASAPLLGSSARQASRRSSHHSDGSHESTPLLSRSDVPPRYYGQVQEDDHDDTDRIPSPAASSLRSLQNQGRAPTKSKRGRWPTYLAIVILGMSMITIMGGVFFAPAFVEEYAKSALVVEPTRLSIDSITSTGVIARVQAYIKLDASRVKSDSVRNIGSFGTWLAREVKSGPSAVQVYLPDYGNLLVGTAGIPGVAVDIRNGHTTNIDILAELQPGDVEGLRQVANDWLEGRLEQVRVLGKADVALKSGIIPLGSQTISESLVFEGNNLPAIPRFNITRLNFREVPVLDTDAERRGMAADASLSVENGYPVRLTIPPLDFDILIPNCGVDEPYIQLADAMTSVVEVDPYTKVHVDVSGIVREIPKTLLTNCPHSDSSPLDLLLGDYLHGSDTRIYFRGSKSPSPDTPKWMANILASITVPVPFPGHTFDGLIRNFSLTDTHFDLPDPLADPDSDESEPRISGTIVVIADLPKEMNFGINITQVRANGNVFHKGDKLGVLDLRNWQAAESKKLEAIDDEDPALQIKSRINNAPLNVTDDYVLTDVLQTLLFSGETVLLRVEAMVEVEVSTVLGTFSIKDLPAEGTIPVKPISTGRGYDDLKLQVGDLRVLSTSQHTLTLHARVNFTNPTEYTAYVPYFNIHILNNGSIIGDSTARSVNVTTGDNLNVVIEATWDPSGFGGRKASEIGRELLSQYVSGFDTNLTLQAHGDTIPHQPEIGRALEKFLVEIPTPRLSGPDTGNGDDDKPQFIQDATFHLFSSTADFTLSSPLQYSSIFVESINATAFYNHTEPIGTINYELPFKVPPGISHTPRIPVEWSLDSVGYEKLREALGGTLKLDAKGDVGIRLEKWSETVWYMGRGIGASVRF